MSKHTPGPWVVYDDYPRDIVTEKCAFLVARCSIIVDSKETEANARLIAAAPEMHEVLEVVEDSPSAALAMFQGEGFVFDGSGGRWEKLAFSLYTHIVDLGEQARAALARAEGE